jgi:hypothetical protein
VQIIQREATGHKGKAVSDPSAVTEASKMSDLLSAASLLLTVLGVVYGTWYSEIVSAIAAPVPDNAPNRGPVRQAVRAALYGKALPQALAATVLTILYLPDALTIALGGLNALRTAGSVAVHEYNAVEAAFCLVVVLTGALACYLISLVCRLKDKLQKIGAPS